MWSEHKLELPITTLERVANLIGIFALTAMVAMIIFQWSSLPDSVPAHFGANGEVDRWGSKWELLILPVLGIVLHLFMQMVEVRPHVHNYPARLNDANREAFYYHSRKMLNLVKNICTLLFAYTAWRVLLIAKGEATDLGMIPFSFLLILLFGTVLWAVIGMSRIR